MRRGGVGALGFLLCLSSLSSGCSALFVNEVPDDHARQVYFDCTSERLAPWLDTAWAALYGIEAAVFAASDSYDGGGGIVAVAGASAIGLGASAYYGFTQTAKCSDAKEKLRQRLLRAPDFAAGGCTFDTQCKDNRLCIEHQCVSLPPPQLPAPLPPPPSSPPPSAAAPNAPTAPTSWQPLDAPAPAPPAEAVPPPLPTAAPETEKN